MITYPFGPADTLVLSATGAQALAINNNLTFIDGFTNTGSGNRTLSLTINSEVKQGAIIMLQTSTAGTQTTAFSTGFLAPTITGVAAKIFTQKLTYNGTQFIPDGTAVQVN